MVNLWVTPDDLGLDSGSPFAYEACQTASFILWSLSGRKFHGTVSVTETYEYPSRGVTRVHPTLIDGEIYNQAGCCQNYYGDGFAVDLRHHHLRLRGRPVQSIQSVQIGGSALSPTEYWLENKAVLGMSNINCLNSLQVSYTYGVRPPMAGRRAARYLAQQLVLSWEGSDECELPERVTSISRQGINYELLDSGTLIDDMRTGIYGVDLFLKAVNPDNARKPARVFSPDIPSAKRVARHLPPSATTVGPWDLQIIPGQPYTWTVDLESVGGSLIDGTTYKPRGQVSTWNGATLYELDVDHFTIVGSTLTCELTAEDTERASLIGRGTWDLYAVLTADTNTVVHLLTSNIWLASQNVTQPV